MKHERYIYILGDVHGDFVALNRFINKEIRQNKSLRESVKGDDARVMILQCGDFAYFWPFCNSGEAIRNRIDWLPGGQVPIYWTGGNHEDWDELDRLGTQIMEVGKGVHYCPFGTTLEISPDVTVLFAGGAESSEYDRQDRLADMANGCEKIWWEQEGVSEADLARLADVPKADWVISHTAPASFDLASKMRGWEFGVHLNEPSRQMLDAVFRKYHPKRWFFGHFHQYAQGETDGCQWKCLANLDGYCRSRDRVYLEWED